MSQDRSHPRRALFWFRRDLRLTDNHGLARALQEADETLCVFVYDTTILDDLQPDDRRMAFIHGSIAALQARLVDAGSTLVVLHGDPKKEIPALAKREVVAAVYANEDYEPAAIERDIEVARRLSTQDIALRQFKDTVIRGPEELFTGQHRPFTVYTPYRNAWHKALREDDVAVQPSARHLDRLVKRAPQALPDLASLGFQETDLQALGVTPGEAGAAALLKHFIGKPIAAYDEAREFPAQRGGSRLSVHNRFGTISSRALARAARSATAGTGPATWLDEVVWREFYMQLLYHFPAVVDAPFRMQYVNLAWNNDKKQFAAWCEGRTGYPVVDAAMRELNQTGTMHNRMRMVTASFLTKDLLIDWRWGERYFARHLLDYDLAQNNGNWQWAASTGCDPQPYFRIFNPSRQSEKFDTEAKYIKHFVPELAKVDAKLLHEPWRHAERLAAAGVVLGRDYPRPVVDHGEARAHTLAVYKQAVADARD